LLVLFDVLVRVSHAADHYSGALRNSADLSHGQLEGIPANVNADPLRLIESLKLPCITVLAVVSAADVIIAVVVSPFNLATIQKSLTFEIASRQKMKRGHGSFRLLWIFFWINVRITFRVLFTTQR
jgi:hypothetical protein